jgi:acylphosphatase
VTGFETGTRRWVVAGRVQGVGYRAFAARAARALSVTGGAANLSDGRVLVEATGPLHALERLEAALWEGSRLARVLTVSEAAQDETPPAGFDVEF